MPRLDKTLADYIAIAISPVLIMLMVGSLLHFIVSVTYSGAYEMRMHWILSCFTVAIVLIARISIEEGPERALMYGVALAGATGIAVSYLANVMFLPFVILGLAWWAAHKITWDCTLIDETQDSSGHGLLQLARFGRKKAETVDSAVDESAGETADGAAADDSANGEMADKDKNDSSEPEGVTERVGRMRDEAHPRREVSGKMHAPGVWILYFSLAALPLFGLGQMFIPVADVARRQAAFSLFCWYVGSGLGLLVTTSFLGLRRYLRQRGVAMPVEMAGAWLTLGAVLILSILFVAALVPRPAAEYEISQFPLKFTTPDRESSRHALGRDGADQNRPQDEPQVTDETRQEGPTGSETKQTSDQPPSETGEPSRQEPGQGDDAR
ncbi:MAG TPA: hypothetical protein DD670_00830, partial [Planctomycetaceae bacterium]|nr:hypothetical protein [Planctomycetaceae bacterium]